MTLTDRQIKRLKLTEALNITHVRGNIKTYKKAIKEKKECIARMDSIQFQGVGYGKNKIHTRHEIRDKNGNIEYTEFGKIGSFTAYWREIDDYKNKIKRYKDHYNDQKELIIDILKDDLKNITFKGLRG